MELTRLGSARSTLEQNSRKAQQHQQQLLLRAPVTGTVQELAVHTEGAVVTPAQVLMKIVPENASIEAEALLQNRMLASSTRTGRRGKNRHVQFHQIWPDRCTAGEYQQ